VSSPPYYRRTTADIAHMSQPSRSVDQSQGMKINAEMEYGAADSVTVRERSNALDRNLRLLLGTVLNKW
jgi:hypothetical protein